MINFEHLKEVLRKTGNDRVVVVDGDETFVLMTLNAYAGESEDFYDKDFKEDISRFEDLNESNDFNNMPIASEVLPDLEKPIPNELESGMEQLSSEPATPESESTVFHEEPPVIPAGIQSENVRYEEF